MHRRIAVLSGKGGTGKSTLTVGVGRALTGQGKRVLLLDLDVGFRCLDLMLGVTDRLVFDLGDVLRGKPLDDALLPAPDCDGLALLAAPAALPDDPAPFSALLASLESRFDFVLLDFPAGKPTLLSAVPVEITSALVVATPDEISLRDAVGLRAYLPDGVDARLVLNRFSRAALRRTSFADLDRVVDTCGLPLAAVVPFDGDLAVGAPASSTSPARAAWQRLAQRLDGKSVPIPAKKI